MSTKRIALLALAHGRSGDKGDAVNIGIIARQPEWYDFLRSELESFKIARYLSGMATGPVVRYEMPNLHALNFLVDGALAGGGSVGLKIDAQGKTYAHALLRYPVDVSPELFAAIERHWDGEMPRECFYPAELPLIRGEESVLAARHDRVLTLTLNRGKARNSLTLELLRTLAAEIRDASERPGSRDKVIILKGDGAAFCAGMDLKAMRNFGTDFANYLPIAQALHDLLSAIILSPLPVICAAHGSAMGGGAALALASDIVVASKDTQFAFPETKIGFIPGMVSVLAMNRMPSSAARELLLTGRPFSAEDGYRLGMVHHLVDGNPTAQATEIAEAMVSQNSAEAMCRSKALLAHTSESDMLTTMRMAVTEFASGATRSSFQEGMAAFAEKRTPDWAHDTRI